MTLRSKPVAATDTEGAERIAPSPLAAVFADPQRFRTWYDACLPRVLAYVYARCGHDHALAEEITQQTFVAAVRHHEQFDGRADVVTWLCAIGRRKLVDHYRRVDRDRRGRVRLLVIDGGPDAVSAVDERDAVASALSTLPGDQRIALTLRHLDRCPVAEIATLLGRSEKATESLLGRAREAFRKAYEANADA
jgi:RNA polymerase sigma-70 factor, ECF subfamily